MKDESFLSRWSRRKNASKIATPPPEEVAPAPAPASAQQPQPASQERAELPPVESLTPESDFSPFMDRDVDEGTKRQALKKLFEDPRYNVMDGLDVYIDDYSKPDPLPEGWLEKMNQVARLGIFTDPREEGERKPAPVGERREKGAEETAPEPPAIAPPAVSSSDTPSAGVPRSKVGESGRPDAPKDD